MYNLKALRTLCSIPDEGAVKPSGGIKVLLCLHFPGGQPGNSHSSSLLIEPSYQCRQIAPFNPPVT